MKKAVMTVIVVVVLVVFAVLAAAPIVNDHVAKRTADGLVDLPLPSGTKLLEEVYQARKLVGNGNGMQYFGAILIQSGQSLEELQEYYGSFAEHEWECVVERQTGTDVAVIEHGRLSFETDAAQEGYYIVYSWGENHTFFHELDIRGH